MKVSGRILSLSLGSLKTQKQCMFQFIQDYSHLLRKIKHLHVWFEKSNICILEHNGTYWLTKWGKITSSSVPTSHCCCYLGIQTCSICNVLLNQSFYWWKPDFKNQSKLTQHKNRVPFLVLRLFFRNKTQNITCSHVNICIIKFFLFSFFLFLIHLLLSFLLNRLLWHITLYKYSTSTAITFLSFLSKEKVTFIL